MRTLETAIKIIGEGKIRLVWNLLLKYCAVPFYTYHLKRNKYRYPKSLEFSWNSYKSIIKPAQKKQEIKTFLEFIRNKKPKVFLEIGTGKGGTLFLFCSVLPKNSRIISVDLRGESYGAGYPSFMRNLLKSYAQGSQVITLVEMDSHNEKTRDYIKTLLSGEVDFLFIDADHTYEGVKRDYELYSKLVKKGGYIAFHDIKAYEQSCGVYKFWDEIKEKKVIEIADKSNPYGIGVVVK